MERLYINRINLTTGEIDDDVVTLREFIENVGEKLLAEEPGDGWDELSYWEDKRGGYQFEMWSRIERDSKPRNTRRVVKTR